MPFIAIPASYAVYEVDDVKLLNNNMKMSDNPPLVVLEVLTMSGQARRVGTIGTVSFNMNSTESDDEHDEEHPQFRVLEPEHGHQHPRQRRNAGADDNERAEIGPH